MMIGDDLSLIKEIAVFFHRKIRKKRDYCDTNPDINFN